MSSSLIPYRGGGLIPSRTDRQLGKALDRLQAGAALEIAETRAAQAVELAKIEAIGAAGDTVLRETARLSLSEAMWAHSAPHAAGRFQLAADATTVRMVERIDRLGRRLG